MSLTGAPGPVIDADSAAFWAGVEQGELRFQRCDACGAAVFYPRCLCPRCLSEELAWTMSTGRATVHSFTVVHRAPPPFDRDVPFVVALVDVEEGFRMMTRVIECAPEVVEIGMPLELEIAAFHDGPGLPCFRPVARSA